MRKGKMSRAPSISRISRIRKLKWMVSLIDRCGCLHPPVETVLSVFKKRIFVDEFDVLWKSLWKTGQTSRRKIRPVWIKKIFCCFYFANFCWNNSQINWNKSKFSVKSTNTFLKQQKWFEITKVQDWFNAKFLLIIFFQIFCWINPRTGWFY